MDRSENDTHADMIRHQYGRFAVDDLKDTGWIPVTVMNDAWHGRTSIVITASLLLIP